MFKMTILGSRAAGLLLRDNPVYHVLDSDSFLWYKERTRSTGRAMDGVGRVSPGEYGRLAARWRRLAEDATTPRTRNHLLMLARQCEFLAGNVADVTAEIAAQENEAGQPDAPR